MKNTKLIKALILSLFMVTTILMASHARTTTVNIQREKLEKIYNNDTASLRGVRGISNTNGVQRENFTIVDWNRHSDNYTENWNYKGLEWLFGPKLRLIVYKYPSMIELKSKSTINYNEKLLFKLIIPKSVVEEGESLSIARLTLLNNKVNESGFLEYDVSIALTYDFNTSQFQVENSIYNATTGEYLTNVTIFTLDSLNSGVIETEETITVNFVGYFESTGVKGIYRIQYNVFDTGNNDYADRSQYDNPFELALGGEYMEFFREKYGDFYTLHITDEKGRKLYTISSNQTFAVELNITTSNILNATVFIGMPPQVPTRTLVVDHYTEMKTYKGGWIYNKTTGKYIWDPNVTILLPVEKFGPHEGFVDKWRVMYVNATYYDWDNGTYYNMTITVVPSLAIIFNNKTKTFETKIYIEYEEYRQGISGPENVKVRRFFNISDLEGDYWDAFKLNLTASSWFEMNGTYHVRIVGYFNEKIGKGIGVINARVVRGDGKELELYTKNGVNYQQNIFVMINKPYLEISSIKGQRDRFIVRKNDTLSLLVRYTGSQKDIEAVDGVQLYFNTWNNWMTENISYSSSLEVILIIDVKRNTTKVLAWNSTEKFVYEYGEYWDYDEYGNPIKKTGYHWEPYFYNQSSGEWERGYVGYRDPATVIEPPFDSVNYTVIYDEVFTNVYVNITFRGDISDALFSAGASLVERYYGEDMSQPL